MIMSLWSVSSDQAFSASGRSTISVDDLDLNQYHGQVVYLDFWASWCGPCRKSFPWLDELQEQHRDDGLVVLGINLDREAESAAEFLADTPVNFQIVLDPEARLAKQYHVAGMPEAIVLGRDGKIAFRHVGFLSKEAEQYEAEIQQLLAQ